MIKINGAFLIFLLSSLGLNNALAENSHQAMLVLDSSQVMKGLFDEKTKIESVKDSLNSALTNWKGDVHLGLTVYGHQQTDSCSDFDVVRPVGSMGLNEITGSISKVEPKGKSLIGLALKEAAATLNHTKEKSTVVLISGGPDTCGSDICLIADDLEKKGADFKAYVVGVNVIEKTQKELECVANLSGGKYYSVNNNASLNLALTNIVERINKKEVIPVAENKKVPFTVIARVKENVEIVASHIVYKVVEGGMNRRIKECTSFIGTPCQDVLPIGKYLVKSRTKDQKTKMLIDIQDGQKNDFTVFIGQTGDLRISASDELDGSITTASHVIHRKKKNKFVFQLNCSSTPEKPCKSIVPVGEYRIKSASSKNKLETLVEVKANKVNKFTVDLSSPSE